MFKRLIASSFIFLLFFTGQIPILNASGEIDIIDSIDNLYNLDNYKSVQSFYGDFKFVDDWSKDEIKGNYKLSFIGQSVQKESYRANSQVRMNGHLTLHYNGDSKDRPFDMIVVNIRAELMSVLNDGIYIKLNSANLNANGVPNDEIEEYLEFKSELDNIESQISQKWLYIPELLYVNEKVIPQGELDAFLDEMKKIGIKETTKSLVDYSVTRQLAYYGTDEELEQASDIIDLFFDTNFFKTKKVTRGNNAGFTAFYLSRQTFMDFIYSINDILKDEITINDFKELRSFMDKMRISGVYRINEEHGIMDNLLIRFRLQNIEGLKHLNLNYRQKIFNMNKEGTITAPNDYMNIEDIEGIEEFY